MERVKKINHKGHEILVIDFSDCYGDKMTEVYLSAKEEAQKENCPVLILNKFNSKTYVTANFLKFIEDDFKEVENLINKQAIVGLSTVQKWIIKGYNQWSSRQLQSFDTIDEALEYLAQ